MHGDSQLIRFSSKSFCSSVARWLGRAGPPGIRGTSRARASGPTHQAQVPWLCSCSGFRPFLNYLPVAPVLLIHSTSFFGIATWQLTWRTERQKMLAISSSVSPSFRATSIALTGWCGKCSQDLLYTLVERGRNCH
jgi:hypothetical protein